MIAYLKGKIIKKTEKGVILSTGNIGYFVHTTNTLLSDLKENIEVEMFIHSQIREDAFDLYGVKNYKELEFFRKLISISGIGPKVALETINQPINKIQNAIINEDIETIKSIPGIGKKTAQRLILELKGKIDLDNLDRQHNKINPSNIALNEAIDALTNLGYQKSHILKSLESIPKNIKEAESVITYFLKNQK